MDDATVSTSPIEDLALRRPTRADGAAIWRLVEDGSVLDRNSPYVYLMWCAFHADASVVAERNGQLVGFVCGLRPPERPDALFVWQVAVDPGQRGLGLAGRMLDALLERPGVRWLEATVTPDNDPSRALFRGLARRHALPCDEQDEWLAADDFPAGCDHAPETLFRIGPSEPVTIPDGAADR